MKAQRLERIPTAKQRAAFYQAISQEPVTDSVLYSQPHQRARFARIKALLDVMLPLCASVLEIGPCEGKLTEVLVAGAPSVTAVEISEPCLERAIARMGEHEVEWVLGDAVDVVDQFIADGRAFDLVVATSVLEHMPDPYALMRGLGHLTSVVLASVPISEPVNPDAFNVEAYRKPKKAADGTGHIWYFRPDTFRGLFSRVYHYQDDGISGIVVGEP